MGEVAAVLGLGVKQELAAVDRIGLAGEGEALARERGGVDQGALGEVADARGAESESAGGLRKPRARREA